MSFASFPIDSLHLPQQHTNACLRAGLSTAADILLATPADLAKKLRSAGGGAIQIPDLVHAVAAAITPRAHTALSLAPATPVSTTVNNTTHSNTGAVPACISTGDAGLDAMLGGGVRVGAITEITGESAAGKSHLTLALAVAAQLPPPLPYEENGDEDGGGDMAAEPPAFGRAAPPPAGTIILTSERILATSRLVELAEGMSAGMADAPPLDEILDNIHTSRVVDIDALEHALAFAIPPMLALRRPQAYAPLMGERAPPPQPDQPDRPDQPERPRHGRGLKPIRLLIVDSITALLRGETERSGTSLTQRSRHLCSIADRLKALAVAYELAVVVVNQVKDVFAPGFGAGLPTPSNLPGVANADARLASAPSSQASCADTAPPMLYATQARHFSGQSPGTAKEAALGIVWANAVNTRLMLARTGRRRPVSDDDLRGVKRGPARPHAAQPHPETEEKELVRRFHLVFSPCAPPAMLDFVILADGVRSLPASLRLVDLGPAIRRRELRLRAALEEPAEDEVPGHPGLDVYDELDIPPELWEGLDDDDEPGSPVAVGVVE